MESRRKNTEAGLLWQPFISCEKDGSWDWMEASFLPFGKQFLSLSLNMLPLFDMMLKTIDFGKRNRLLPIALECEECMHFTTHEVLLPGKKDRTFWAH